MGTQAGHLTPPGTREPRLVRLSGWGGQGCATPLWSSGCYLRRGASGVSPYQSHPEAWGEMLSILPETFM